MTPITLALAVGFINPTDEVFKQSIASMNSRQVFTTAYTQTTTSKRGNSSSRFLVQARRPDQAFIASLDKNGKVVNSVAFGAGGRIVSKTEVSQHIKLEPITWDDAVPQLVEQIPGLDLFVISGLAPKGWDGYIKDILAQGKGWKPRFTDGQWKLSLASPNGQLTLTFRSGDFLPVEMRLAGGGTLNVWRIDHSTKVQDSFFEAPKQSRLVARFQNFPPPNSYDPLSKPLVEKLFKNFDVTRSLAIETDAGGHKTRILAKGARIRQTVEDVDWSYDGKTVTIMAEGKVSRHKVKSDKMLELVAQAGGRLDPLWGDLLSGANPFRRLLSGADIRHKGVIETPEGQVALLQVTGKLENLSLGLRVSDARVISLSRIPRADKHQGVSISSMKRFRYLDESVLAKTAAFDVTNRGA